MGEPAKKRARALALISLGKKSYASHSGIEALPKHIIAHGTPFTSSRKAQYDARKTITRTVTAYGPMVVEVDVPLAAGGTTQIPFQNPLACFVYQCKDSPHYASIVQEALRRHPCTPGSPWKPFCTRMVLIHRIWDQRIIRGSVVFFMGLSQN